MIDEARDPEPEQTPEAPPMVLELRHQAPPTAPMPAMPLSLFGDNPREAVARVAELASAITDEVRRHSWIVDIRGKKGQRSEHPTIEAWTYAGGLAGVFAVVTHTERVKYDGVHGWEARAEARTMAGNVVGAADGLCMANEPRWSDTEEHARKSMAQTRAMSRALAGPLRFLMEQAGFSGTPAEDLNDGGKRAGDGARTSDRADTRGKQGPTDRQIGMACGLFKRLEAAGALSIEKTLPQLVEHYGATLAAEDAQPNQLEATLRTLQGGRGGSMSQVIDRLKELAENGSP